MASAGAVYAAASVFAAAGAVYSGYKQKQIGDFNEKMAKREAQYQENKAELNEQRHRDSVKRVIAQQKVAFAQSGVDLLSATVQDVATDSQAEAELDAMIIREGGGIEARRALQKGWESRTKGRTALVGSVFSAGSTVINAWGGEKATAPGKGGRTLLTSTSEVG